MTWWRFTKLPAKRCAVRAGEGPTLIECKTYRTRAHAEGMSDFGYRTHEDVDVEGP
ncbi:MAG: thiamine pyrophosphate-dependent enzyme [Caldilineaceae bacterium]